MDITMRRFPFKVDKNWENKNIQNLTEKIFELFI